MSRQIASLSNTRPVNGNDLVDRTYLLVYHSLQLLLLMDLDHQPLPQVEIDTKH
jgi:hypothetical protein